MPRFVVALFLASFLLSSMGCRMCSSPYDYCLSTHIDRPDDYRGCGPLYRAGSILSDDGCGIQQVSHDGDVLYVRNGGEFASNAGSYGMTMPIVQPTRGSDSRSFPRQETTRQETIRIGIPQDQQPSEPAQESGVPTIQELLRKRGGTPEPMRPVPINPPSRPRVEIPDFERPLIETTPFSPTDEPVLPPTTNPFPTTTNIDPPITLEELRRLDPSVREVQIISIEDAATGTSVY